jgi:hypothetical protein
LLVLALGVRLSPLARPRGYNRREREEWQRVSDLLECGSGRPTYKALIQ